MADAAREDVEEQLRRQAAELGLQSWHGAADDAIGEDVIESNRVQMAQIAAFAGLRGSGRPSRGDAAAEDSNAHDGGGDVALDLHPYFSPVELEELGMDFLKGELIRLGLKCGGTLAERAKRLFEVTT